MNARINVNQIVSRVRIGVAEMSYAQRRVFENRTGVVTADRRHGHGACGPGGGPVIATSTAELEALYARDVTTGWR